MRVAVYGSASRAQVRRRRDLCHSSNAIDSPREETEMTQRNPSATRPLGSCDTPVEGEEEGPSQVLGAMALMGRWR